MATYWQQQLIDYCSRRGLGQPCWQDFSDVRGGRTAWSSRVAVQGHQINAVFCYDLLHAPQAREDAAEEALIKFGVIPSRSRVSRPHGAIF